MDNTLFTIPRFLSREECRELIDYAEGIGFEAAPITTAGGFVMMPEVRNNTRVMVDDLPRAKALWGKLASHIPAREGWTAVGLNERFRYYRYELEEAFRWHHDGRFRRNQREESALTFMIYLNEEFEGGQTQFQVWSRNRSLGLEDRAIVPSTGMALLFDHAIRHQGAPVTEGVKYVLRSDVMFRRE